MFHLFCYIFLKTFFDEYIFGAHVLLIFFVCIFYAYNFLLHVLLHTFCCIFCASHFVLHFKCCKYCAAHLLQHIFGCKLIDAHLVLHIFLLIFCIEQFHWCIKSIYKGFAIDRELYLKIFAFWFMSC